MSSCDSSTDESLLGRVDEQRWRIAAVMVWVGFNQGIVWMTFSASAAEMRACLPGAVISDAEVNLLLNWGPITYMISVWPYMLTMSRYGQRAVHDLVLWSGVLIAAGAVFRCAPFVWHLRPQLWLHAGQILNGLGGPVSAAVAPAFAATWFPAEERTLATSLVWMVQSLGPSVGFLVALAARGCAGLRGILLVEAISSAAALTCWALVVPKLPRYAPSASAAAQRERPEADCDSGPRAFASNLLQALCRQRFWLLAISGGISVGAFQCWSSSLGVVFEDASSAGFAGGINVGVLLALVGNLGCFIGTLVAAPLAERFFRRCFKTALILSNAFQVLLLGSFAFLVPTAAGAEGPFAILVVLLAASIFNGLSAPICFELGAEITYPSPEGVSGSAYSFTVNFGGFVVMAALSGASLTGVQTCLLMAGIVAAGLCLLAPVREVYPRLAVDVPGGNIDPGALRLEGARAPASEAASRLAW